MRDHVAARAAGGSTRRTGDDADAVLSALAASSSAQQSSENFPVALRVLPRRPRRQLACVYQFARFVDDVGDTAPGDRLALLDRIEADLRALPDGAPQLAPVAALRPLPDDVGIGLQPFLDLIEANRRDQVTTRYADFAALLDYCSKSAAPVGRLVLAIAGVDDEAAARRSDAICAALQVLEHCQDVGEDAQRGRIYLPAADLRAARVEEPELMARMTTPALRRVVAQQVDRAAGLLDEGMPLLGQLRGWARLAVTGYVAGGLATVRALRAADHDVLSRTVRPATRDTTRAAARLLVRRSR